jgi:hypothetical protein
MFNIFKKTLNHLKVKDMTDIRFLQSKVQLLVVVQ